MKLKEYIKSLGFRWTDISIIPFFVFTILLVLEDVSLMIADVGVNLSHPLWVYIVYSAISFLSLITFLFFELKKGYKLPITALAVLLFVLAFNVVATYSKQNAYLFTLKDINNEPFSLTLNISNSIKYIHLISFIFFLISVFIWVFIFPKKFKNFNFIKLLVYAFHFLSLFVLIFSFINDDYITYLGMLFGGMEGFELIKDYIPCSFFGNPNVYAFYLEIGIFLSFFHHAITGRKTDYVLTAIYYLLLVFTICKTGILIASLLILVYLIFLYLKSFIRKNTLPIIVISIIFLLLLEVITFVIKSYFYSDIIKEKIDFFLGSISSFTGRKEIWNLGYQLFSANLFYGLGHGIYNSLLYVGLEQISEFGFRSSHNSFLTILGEGGIVYLLTYASLVVYAFFLAIKMIKKNLNLSLALIFGLLLFLIHSYLEDIYYYTELIVVFTAISYNVYKSQNEVKKELHINKEAQA